MAFNEKLPKWDNVGVEPPESKKTEGWQPTEKPPAQWFNWLLNRNYKVMEEIRAKVVEKETGKGLSTNDYTTTEKNKLAGIAEGANETTINNTLTSTSTTQALSANQGKVLNDGLVAHKADYAKDATKFTIESDATYNRNGYYYKKNGWVQVYITISRVDGGNIGPNAVVYILPVGFRTDSSVDIVAFNSNLTIDPPIESSLVRLFADGAFQVRPALAKPTIVIAFTFYAGGGTV